MDNRNGPKDARVKILEYLISLKKNYESALII